MKKTFVFIGMIALIAAGCNKTSQNDSQSQPSSQSFKYQNSYVTGYEGDFYNVSYSFEYPVAEFMATDDATSKAKVQLRQKDNNNVHFLSIFYNGAAGVASSADYLKDIVKCSNCALSSKTFSIPDGKDVKVYEDSNSYYLIYAHDPGYVYWHIAKPSDEMEKVVSSLQVNVTKTSQNPMQ